MHPCLGWLTTYSRGWHAKGGKGNTANGVSHFSISVEYVVDRLIAGLETELISCLVNRI